MLLAVRKIRLEKGLALAEAARCVGIAPAVLSRIETGQQVPWRRLRSRLTDLYGVPETELFHELDEARRYLKVLGGEQGDEDAAPTR